MCAIPADSIARAFAYAIEQPADVDVNEIVVRPAAERYSASICKKGRPSLLTRSSGPRLGEI